MITVPVGRVCFHAPDGRSWIIRVARAEAPGDATFDPRGVVS